MASDTFKQSELLWRGVQDAFRQDLSALLQAFKASGSLRLQAFHRVWAVFGGRWDDGSALNEGSPSDFVTFGAVHLVSEGTRAPGRRSPQRQVAV